MTMATHVYFYGVNWGTSADDQAEGERHSAPSVWAADEAGRALLAEWEAVVVRSLTGATLLVVGR
jgi:hypothetical protein